MALAKVTETMTTVIENTNTIQCGCHASNRLPVDTKAGKFKSTRLMDATPAVHISRVDSVDKSIAPLDSALRRWFQIIKPPLTLWRWLRPSGTKGAKWSSEGVTA